eukprot:7385831-Prymnesium_polylepis.11
MPSTRNLHRSMTSPHPRASQAVHDRLTKAAFDWCEQIASQYTPAAGSSAASGSGASGSGAAPADEEPATEFVRVPDQPDEYTFREA